MHDIERGGNATAVRLAALAALRKAEADGTPWDSEESKPTGPARGLRGRGPQARAPREDHADPQVPPSPRITSDGTTGVLPAVEAAIRRSRIEFVGRLFEYREKLDCETLMAGPDLPDSAMEEAQFIAHRIAGVGKTLGFADLGAAAREAETAIAAWKLERGARLGQTSIKRICNLVNLIEDICADDRQGTA